VAKLTLTNAAIWFGQYNLGSYHNTLDVKANKAIQDTTAMGSTWSTNLAGVLGASFSGGGFWDMTAPVTPDFEYYNGTISATDRIISVSADGGDIGEVAYTMQALAGEYSGFGAYGDPAPFAINATADGPLVRGIVLGNATAAGAGDGAGQTYVALVAGQTLYAALHVVTFTATSCTIKVQTDADNNWTAGATDRITFTSVTAATYEWKTYTTAYTHIYYRYDISAWVGTGSLVFALVVGVV